MPTRMDPARKWGEGVGQCLAKKAIMDEVHSGHLFCENDVGHEGKHRTTYPGLDGDGGRPVVAYPLTWESGDAGVVAFKRGFPCHPNDLR